MQAVKAADKAEKGVHWRFPLPQTSISWTLGTNNIYERHNI